MSGTSRILDINRSAVHSFTVSNDAKGAKIVQSLPAETLCNILKLVLEDIVENDMMTNPKAKLEEGLLFPHHDIGYAPRLECLQLTDAPVFWAYAPQGFFRLDCPALKILHVAHNVARYVNRQWLKDNLANAQFVTISVRIYGNVSCSANTNTLPHSRQPVPMELNERSSLDMRCVPLTSHELVWSGDYREHRLFVLYVFFSASFGSDLFGRWPRVTTLALVAKGNMKFPVKMLKAIISSRWEAAVTAVGQRNT
ncbi:hypothetical protein DFH29DRAFT_879864 [Suillus ampliporus]|nr:hypothetical protein DFH29DRAFT_879864 [Suillus ampliporus]